MNRREFFDLLGKASITAGLAGCTNLKQAGADSLYELPQWGDARLMHITDTHAQLLPIHFREPNVNLGLGTAFNTPPHLVGTNLLKHFAISPGSIEAHAFTYLNFASAAGKYGKVGGFAHLQTLVRRIRDDRVQQRHRATVHHDGRIAGQYYPVAHDRSGSTRYLSSTSMVRGSARGEGSASEER